MSLLSQNIDRNSPIPIYYQIKQSIEHLIDSGQLRPGDLLPSENEFSKAYKISPMTVRQAMTELVNEGYIHRERGRGTYVSQRRLSHQLERLMSFSEDMKSRNMVPSSKILLIEETHPPRVVIKKVGLGSSEKVVRIKRIRLADEQPVGIHDTYIYGVEIERKELEQTQSLYKILEDKGVYLHEGIKTIEAVSATKEFAALLKVEPGASLLQTMQFSWDKSGNFVEFVIAHYHSELYQYTIQLRR